MSNRIATCLHWYEDIPSGRGGPPAHTWGTQGHVLLVSNILQGCRELGCTKGIPQVLLCATWPPQWGATRRTSGGGIRQGYETDHCIRCWNVRYLSSSSSSPPHVPMSSGNCKAISNLRHSQSHFRKPQRACKLNYLLFVVWLLVTQHDCCDQIYMCIKKACVYIYLCNPPGIQNNTWTHKWWYKNTKHVIKELGATQN